MARDRLQQARGGQYGRLTDSDHSVPSANSGNLYASAAAATNNPYASQPAYPPAPQPVVQQYSKPTRGQLPQYSQGGAGGYSQQNQYGRAGAGAYGQQDQYAGSGNNEIDFLTQASDVSNLIKQLEGAIATVNVENLKTLDNAPNAPNAEAASEDARALREQCMDAIKQITHAAKTPAEVARGKLLKEDFNKALQKHQTVESDYRKKTKERIVRQLKIVKNPIIPTKQEEEAAIADPQQVFSQALLSNGGRLQGSRTTMAEVQTRNTELQKIEKTMGELAQMMNEMAMMVEQQDEAITTVENNARDTHQNVEAGNVQLDGAVIKARKARKKKWICFIIVLIIVLVVALAVGLKVGLDNNNKN